MSGLAHDNQLLKALHYVAYMHYIKIFISIKSNTRSAALFASPRGTASSNREALCPQLLACHPVKQLLAKKSYKKGNYCNDVVS